MEFHVTWPKHLGVFGVSAVLGPVPAPSSDRDPEDAPLGRDTFTVECEHLRVV